MNLILKVAATTAFLATMIQPATAGSIDETQHLQEHRIAQGVRSGELTRWETKSLLKEQKRVAQLERQFRSDGHLGPVERKVLNSQFSTRSLESTYL